MARTKGRAVWLVALGSSLAIALVHCASAQVNVVLTATGRALAQQDTCASYGRRACRRNDACEWTGNTCVVPKNVCSGIQARRVGGVNKKSRCDGNPACRCSGGKRCGMCVASGVGAPSPTPTPTPTTDFETTGPCDTHFYVDKDLTCGKLLNTCANWAYVKCIKSGDSCTGASHTGGNPLIAGDSCSYIWDLHLLDVKLEDKATFPNIIGNNPCKSPFYVNKDLTCGKVLNTCGGWAELKCVQAGLACTGPSHTGPNALIAGDSCSYVWDGGSLVSMAGTRANNGADNPCSIGGIVFGGTIGKCIIEQLNVYAKEINDAIQGAIPADLGVVADGSAAGIVDLGVCTAKIDANYAVTSVKGLNKLSVGPYTENGKSSLDLVQAKAVVNVVGLTTAGSASVTGTCGDLPPASTAATASGMLVVPSNSATAAMKVTIYGAGDIVLGPNPKGEICLKFETQDIQIPQCSITSVDCDLKLCFGERCIPSTTVCPLVLSAVGVTSPVFCANLASDLESTFKKSIDNAINTSGKCASVAKCKNCMNVCIDGANTPTVNEPCKK